MRNFLCPVFEYRQSVFCEGCRDRKYHTHPVFYFLKLTSWHSKLGKEMVILDQNICQEYLETKFLESEVGINMKSLREILLCVCVGLSSRVPPGNLSSQVPFLLPRSLHPQSRQSKFLHLQNPLLRPAPDPQHPTSVSGNIFLYVFNGEFRKINYTNA